MPTEPPSPLDRANFKAADFAAIRDWPGYYGKMLGKPARETLVAALARFEAEGRDPAACTAIDLGCGEGRDALELLRRGWSVLATDDHPDAISLLTSRVPEEERPRLRTSGLPFHLCPMPPVDLVNASYSLPFCDPARFDSVWARVVAALKPGGRFAGQLFGDRDTWARLPDRSHQSESRARELLRQFEVEQFTIEEKDETDATGNPKHWHIFHVVARLKAC